MPRFWSRPADGTPPPKGGALGDGFGWGMQASFLALPHPGGVSESMHVPCNAPLVVSGVVVGYCGRPVKVRPRRRVRRFEHRGRHRIEWQS